MSGLWKRVAVSLAIAAATVGVLPAVSGAATKSSPGMFAAALRQLVAMPGGPPGAVAIVQIGKRRQVVSAGVADVTTKATPTANDELRIASVSKAYNGAIALALASRGKLSLDATVGKLLPTLPRAWSSVTVAELLQHTSGVPDYIKNPAFLKQLTADPQQSMTPAQLLGFVQNDPLLFKPGSKYHYSDSDNIVLGLIIEAKTGQGYEAALRQYVTDPLHLGSTYLPANTGLSEPYLHGYDPSGGATPEDVTMALNPALAWASGGMVSTVAELNTFMRAYVGGRFESRTVRRRQLTFVKGGSGPPGPGANSAGLALYRYDTRCGVVYGHTGNFPGYTVFAASNLAGTRSVDVVVNAQFNELGSGGQYKALRAAEAVGVCVALGR